MCIVEVKAKFTWLFFRLITNQARFRITIKKRMSDCAILGCRYPLLLPVLLPEEIPQGGQVQYDRFWSLLVTLVLNTWTRFWMSRTQSSGFLAAVILGCPPSENDIFPLLGQVGTYFVVNRRTLFASPPLPTLHMYFIIFLFFYFFFHLCIPISLSFLFSC